MCLDLKFFAFRRKAKEDIKVFKVLYYREGKYFTPFQHYQVEIGKEYTSKLDRKFFSVEDGLHSFEDYMDAWFVAQVRQAVTTRSEYIVVGCTIPKGAYYYKGFYGHDVSYASDRLIIN